MPTKKLIKISASQGVSLVEDFLFKGLGREFILQEIKKSYKISEGAIDKWIRIAKPKAEARQKEAEEIRLREMDAASLDALKSGLKSDLELEVFLCQLAAGDIKIEELVAGISVLRGPTPTERVKAIEQLFKKRGSYAPTKVAQTDKEGNDVVPFTDSQVDKILHAIETQAG